MKELIIEFGNDTLGEARLYQRNLKGYEQAVKDLKLYKAQQKVEIDYLKFQIKAECKEHQEAMRLADKTIKKLERAIELACNDIYWISAFSGKFTKEEFISHKIDYYIKQAEEMMKSDN